MALFGKKKEVNKEPVVTVAKSAPAMATDRNLSGILVKPHFTEKTGRAQCLHLRGEA
jgi:hypothetical protein